MFVCFFCPLVLVPMRNQVQWQETVKTPIYNRDLNRVSYKFKIRVAPIIQYCLEIIASFLFVWKTVFCWSYKRKFCKFPVVCTILIIHNKIQILLFFQIQACSSVNYITISHYSCIFLQSYTFRQVPWVYMQWI